MSAELDALMKIVEKVFQADKLTALEVENLSVPALELFNTLEKSGELSTAEYDELVKNFVEECERKIVPEETKEVLEGKKTKEPLVTEPPKVEAPVPVPTPAPAPVAPPAPVKDEYAEILSSFDPMKTNFTDVWLKADKLDKLTLFSKVQEKISAANAAPNLSDTDKKILTFKDEIVTALVDRLSQLKA